MKLRNLFENTKHGKHSRVNNEVIKTIRDKRHKKEIWWISLTDHSNCYLREEGESDRHDRAHPQTQTQRGEKDKRSVTDELSLTGLTLSSASSFQRGEVGEKEADVSGTATITVKIASSNDYYVFDESIG